jgi:hypothetical protein
MHEGFPFKVTQTPMVITACEVEVCTAVSVTSIETGEPIVVQCVERYPADVPPEHALAFLANQIRDILLHEIDECLIVAGRKWRNPHVHIGARCPDHKACQIAMVSREEKLFSCTTSSERRSIP